MSCRRRRHRCCQSLSNRAINSKRLSFTSLSRARCGRASSTTNSLVTASTIASPTTAARSPGARRCATERPWTPPLSVLISSKPCRRVLFYMGGCVIQQTVRVGVRTDGGICFDALRRGGSAADEIEQLTLIRTSRLLPRLISLNNALLQFWDNTNLTDKQPLTLGSW